MENKKQLLDVLLKKFDEANTTQQEELKIKELLKEFEEQEYLFYKTYFDTINQEKKLENKNSTIDFSFLENENSEKKQKQKSSVFNRKSLWKVASVAVILIGTLIFSKNQQAKLEQAQAELAFEQTIEALNLVGSKMNTAKQKIEYIELFNEKTKPYINLNQK